MEVLKYIFLNLPEDDQKSLLKSIKANFKEQLSGEIYQNVRKGKEKSDLAYLLLTAISPIVKFKSVTSIRNNFAISGAKAKKLFDGDKIIRNVKRLSQNKIIKIDRFYKRDDISRVTGSLRETTKKHGPRRYMNFPFRVAYKIFKDENPSIQLSFSKFHILKPKNIRTISNTPLISSLCVYCQNVKLKLQAINVSGLTSEYELFCKLTCKKESGKTFRDSKCIFKTCPNCKDWEDYLRLQISDKADIDKK